jgi:membrane-associated phospholipid phosphatase
MKIFFLVSISFLLAGHSFGQDTDTIVAPLNIETKLAPVYKMKYGLDIPVAVGGTAWTLYAFTKIYGGDKTPEAEILALNANNLNSIDRSTTKNYSEKAKAASDKFFYGSMPAPLLLLFDKKIRKDAAKVGLLYLQAMAITGTIYTSSSMIARRFRPYTYNPEVDMSTRRGGGGRNSFPAGHPAVVATSTFFMAKVFSDYHPEMKNKWILYTIAGSASLATGILRIKAGQHFPTDVMTGIPIGILSGILVPHFHRNKKNSNLSLLPYSQGRSNGLTAILKL